MAHLDEKTREPREDPVEEDLKGGIVTTAPVEDLDEAAIFLREHNFTQGYLAELLEDSQANKKIVRRIDLTPTVLKDPLPQLSSNMRDHDAVRNLRRLLGILEYRRQWLEFEEYATLKQLILSRIAYLKEENL
ncbi:hypothetical protein OHC33_000622 [Knufia fluminis]|uniref:Uncharacterized protein n=1 Tax=Knufia fluminis TaxID=191047 RepID=A0AAN8EM59_9EURO|nr:hypothetical protein OHC33_000622 [Knufia fluminis]